MEIWQLSPWNLLLILTQILRFSLRPQEPIESFVQPQALVFRTPGAGGVGFGCNFPSFLGSQISHQEDPRDLDSTSGKIKAKAPPQAQAPCWKAVGLPCGPPGKLRWWLASGFGQVGSRGVSAAGARPCGVLQHRLQPSGSQSSVWSSASPELGRED